MRLQRCVTKQTPDEQESADPEQGSDSEGCQPDTTHLRAGASTSMVVVVFCSVILVLLEVVIEELGQPNS